MVALSLLILAGIRALLMERQQTAPMFEFQGRALVFTEITKPIEFPRYLEIGGCFHYSSGALSQMAELEKKRFQEPMQQMWESIMEFSHKQERSKFDFKARSFE